jgi:hypothetical protein
MNRPEAEKIHRVMIHDWARETGFSVASGGHPSFSVYKDWATEKSPSLFGFRSRMGADYDVELWFDQELKQLWRR